MLCGVVALWGLLPLLKFGPLVDWRTLQLCLPLSEAARKLYGHTRGSLIAEFAEGSSEGSSDVLNWYAYWMVQHGVRIYGVHPPSKILELVKTEDATDKLHFVEGATVLRGGYDKQPAFERLCVRYSDLWKHWEKLTKSEL